MTTQSTKLLMINTKMNLCMNRIHIQGTIEYVDNTMNIEPVRVKETNSGKVYNYVGNAVEIQPEDL